MSRGARIAIGVVISAVALYLALPPREEWATVGEAFARINYWYVVPLALVSVLSIFIRAQRWQLLLRPVGDVPVLALFSATCIGFFCNMVLPLRAGEVVRPVLLSRRTSVPLSSVFASVLVERLLDMLTILVFLGAVVLVLPVSDTIRNSGTVFVIFAAAAVVLVLALQQRNRRALGLLAWVVGRMPAGLRARVDPAIQGFIDGLQGIGSTRALPAIILYSFYLWFVIAAVFALGIVACNLDVPLVIGSIAVVTVVAGAVSAPSAPGFIGTYQAGCVLGLALFGVDRADATPFAIIIWAVQWLTQIILGVVFVLRENVSFRGIQAVEKP